jgi:predicted nucleotidyltransferase component of viral defense system
MVDINKHRFYMVQILKDIYTDISLSNNLGFKGGSAAMFFYDLPRFSVDLVFNLLNAGEKDNVYHRLRKILLKYGTIYDEAGKHFGPLLVLDYGKSERKLKIEISKRDFEDRYEIKNLLGIGIRVMVKDHMFSHRLCALRDRPVTVNRDIFDCWHFAREHTAIKTRIIEARMHMPLNNYLEHCISYLESRSDKGMLDGLEELLDHDMKQFMKIKLRSELISLMKIYREYPMTTES